MVSKVTGIDKVNRNIKTITRRLGGPMTEKFITEFIIVVAGYSASMTPIATGTLINSQFRRIYATPLGKAGEVGYGAAYAAAVHDAPGALLGTDTDRYPKRLGKVWGPNAEPEFLTKALQMAIDNDLQTLLKRHYKL